jgi:hypothetical protein
MDVGQMLTLFFLFFLAIIMMMPRRDTGNEKKQVCVIKSYNKTVVLCMIYERSCAKNMLLTVGGPAG